MGPTFNENPLRAISLKVESDPLLPMAQLLGYHSSRRIWSFLQGGDVDGLVVSNN